MGKLKTGKKQEKRVGFRGQFFDREHEMTHRRLNSIFVLSQLALCLTILLSAQSTIVGQLTAFDRESIKIHDSVRLRSGVRLYGEIVKEGKDQAGRDFTIIRTENKSTLKLDKRFVSSSHSVDDDDKIYNNKIKIMDDTAEQHWSAVKWCEKQRSGAIRYKDQIDFHLNRIMLLDPNDTRVRHRLDYDYLEEQDRWVPRKLYWTSLGYRSRGKAWVPTLQDDVSQFSESTKSDLGDRKSRFSIWKRNVSVGKLSLNELSQELFAICDALSVPLLFEEAKKVTDPEIAAIYIEAFGKVQSGGAAQALVYFSVEGGVNRDRALDLLLQDHYQPSFVAGHLARYFDPNKYSNETLQRAAFNVGVVDDINSVLPLVGVLSTKHVVSPGEDPNRLTTSFSGNGQLQGFSTGGSGGPKTVVVQNSKVLEALRKLSGGEDLGFDPVGWKKWYVENHSQTDVNVRGDIE